MNHFVLSADRDEGLSYILTAIKEYQKAGVSRMYMLVPEQETHQLTRQVCTALGDSASRYIEVLGFERLWTRIKEAVGGDENIMDEGGCLLTMSKAVADVRGELTQYRDAATHSETIQDLLRTRRMLMMHCAADDGSIYAVLESAPEVMKAKSNDLLAIFKQYDKICDENHLSDPDKLPDLTCKKLDNSDWLKGSSWFVYGFTELPKRQRQLVRKLMLDTNDVTLYLPCNGIYDEHPSNVITAATLAALIKDLKEPSLYTIDSISETAPKSRPALSWLREELCEASPANEFKGVSPEAEVALYADDTAYGECKHIAGDILRMVHDGARFRDNSVVLCDYARYAPVFQAVAARYGIPAYFSSRKEAIAKKPVMLAIHAALDASTRGMDKIDVLKYLKSGVSNLPQDDVDLLELYALTWNIHGRGWEPASNWTMNPDGYGLTMNEESEARLARINVARESGIKPLLALRDAMKAGETIGEYIMALYDFMQGIHFTDTLQGIVNHMVENGDEQSAMEYAQISEVLSSCMDQMYRESGDMKKQAADFVKLFKLICATNKLDTIPATLDQVTVYDLADARFSGTKNRFIAGATEGIFPNYAQGSGGVLNNNDVASLKMDGTLEDMNQYLLSRSLSDIALVLAGGKEKITFSYSTEHDSTPSYLLSRVKEIFPSIDYVSGTDESHIYPVDMMTPEAAGKLLGRIAQKPQYVEYVMALCGQENPELQIIADRIMDKASWALGDLSAASVLGLYGERISLSATKSDIYSACRYHYFLKYGLHIAEPFRGKIDAPVFGKFAHMVLENTIKEVEAEHGGFAHISTETLNDITHKYIEEYKLSNLKGLADQPERYTYLFQRNCREIMAIIQDVCDEFKASDFKPTAFEMRVGGEDADMPAISIHGSTAEGYFTGVTDRVDTCEVDGQNYFRVVDYKTGKSKTLDLSDLLAGKSLQLLLYQTAISKDGLPRYAAEDMTEAGILYCPAKEPIIASQTKLSAEKVMAERQKERTRHGMLLNDKAVLYAMEHSEDGNPQFLPIKYSADGIVTGDICTDAQMRMLNAFTDVTMGEIVDGIASGEVKANPISRGMDRNACTYCPMKAACHKDSCGIKFRYHAQVKADEFWNAIREKVKGEIEKELA